LSVTNYITANWKGLHIILPSLSGTHYLQVMLYAYIFYILHFVWLVAVLNDVLKGQSPGLWYWN